MFLNFNMMYAIILLKVINIINKSIFNFNSIKEFFILLIKIFIYIFTFKKKINLFFI